MESEHPLELELKYRADDPAPMRALAAVSSLGPVALGPASVAHEVDRYLDTADLRLAAARWACRLRTRDARTTLSLKGPSRHEPQDALHRRPEVEGPAGPGADPGTWPPSPARDLLASLAGGSASQLSLVERFTLEQRRTERTVLAGGRRIGLMSLDEVTVLRDSKARGTLLMVELEFVAGEPQDPRLVAELGAALADVVGLQPDPHTKLEHALTLLRERDAGG
ncbi:MAG TPA: CYTH domain-containing protein [Candidatus Limnocylindria bacterium]